MKNLQTPSAPLRYTSYRLLFLLTAYAATVAIFVAAKVVFMLVCGQGQQVSIADMADVALHGLSLDMSTALYFLILPLLTCVASLWCSSGVLRKVLNTYFAIIAAAFALAFVADSTLYPFWGFKLDASCLQYLETPSEATASVSIAFLCVRAVVLIAAAIVIYIVYTRCMLLFDCRRKVSSLPLSLATYVLLVPVFIVGIRGGLDESTTNIGQVYFSQRQFLNHSAVNPVFSFLASMEKTASANVVYNFFTTEECYRLADGIYPATTRHGSDATPALTDTLLRIQRPNVVIILLESCGSQFLTVMPRLRQLMAESVSFTNCYANSYRTDRGTLCTLSGYPSFPTMSVMKMPAKTRTLPSIASSLKAKGYNTHYLYGGDINFTNMRSYLVGTGFEKLTWKADYSSSEQNTAEWGVRDDITFRTLYNLITSQPHNLKTPKPQNHICYSTLSTHEPWDVPVHIDSINDEVLNAFAYLDLCIGKFINSLRRTPQWDNLLLVLLPDHSINHGQLDELHPDRNRIPMIWTGGAIIGPRQLTALCNQTDLAATLLAQMGIDHSAFTFSRNVTSTDYRRQMAFHTFNNGFSIIDSTGFTVYDLDANRIIKHSSATGSSPADSTHARRMERVGKAILQLTSTDLKER